MLQFQSRLYSECLAYILNWMQAVKMTSDSFHETVVVMTGTFLSSLMKENLQPGSEKEGFLLGKSTLQKVQVNNDVQSDVPLEQRRIVLSDFLCCDRIGEFYSNTGRLVDDKLTSLFEDDPGLVVGWYRFRRRAPCRPSLRERAIHAELCRRRPAADRAGFVFLLMADNAAEDVVQHEQRVLVLKDRRLIPARLEVANIGETGGGEYRSTPFCLLGPLLPAGGGSVDGGALSAALAVQSSARDQLRLLLGRLERSERDTAAAYREVEELRLRLADRQAAGQ